MTEFKNEFSWSFSRHRKFYACKRQYYFHYYGSWGGWEKSTDKITRKLFQLKNMITLPMLAGSVIHRIIAIILEALKNGHEITAENAETEVIQFFKKAWRESKDGEWKTSPKSKTNLFEHYYEQHPTDDELLEIKETMVESIRGFYLSDSFTFIKSLSPKQWLTKEDFDKYDFYGTRVWVKIDFAARYGDRIYIYDWKTGKEVSEDETQLAVYALYALSKWDIDVNDLRLSDIYLKKQLPVQVKLNEAVIARAKEVMGRSIDEMKELLDDEFENLASIDNFPTTDIEWICRRCFFKEICYPDNWSDL